MKLLDLYSELLITPFIIYFVLLQDSLGGNSKTVMIGNCIYTILPYEPKI
jgi:hypothetical protein